MPVIRVWFYDPAGDKEGVINHLVARMDGPFCHCEVQFPDDHACTIYMGTQVVLKRRTFDPRAYTGVHLSCNQLQLEQARTFAQGQYDAGVCFSTVDMSLSLLPQILPQTSSGTFCSKLCADILVAGGILDAGTRTHKLSPSALHRLISTPKRQTHFASSPVVAIDFR